MSDPGRGLLAVLFLDLAVILLVARVGGWAARRCGQPLVVGEILAGLGLGPLLTSLSPDSVEKALFPAAIEPLLGVVAQIALVLYMFQVGHELRFEVARSVRRQATAVSLGSIVLPFVGGIGLGILLHARHSTPAGPDLLPFALFLGTTLSVTAMPVLARIIADSHMRGSGAATTALIAASVSDVVAWCALALVTALQLGGDDGDAAVSAGSFVGLVVLLWGGVRPLYRRLAERVIGSPHAASFLLVAVAVGLFASAWATTAVGLHAVIGAFAFGVALPRDVLRSAAPDLLAVFVQLTALLLPVFFVLTGLTLDPARGHWSWPEFMLILGVACLSKLVGAGCGALAGGAGRHDAASIGVLMNTRGLTELVLLQTGLAIGALDGSLFLALTVTALVTTVVTTPLIRILDRPPRGGDRPGDLTASTGGS